MIQRLSTHCHHWPVRAIYGFVNTHTMRFQSNIMDSGVGDFQISIISRRSRLRAGTRYITRGVDSMGHVANFVETEQLVWSSQSVSLYSSFLLIRGSVPVFWRQNNGIAKPSPELDATLVSSRRAFTHHFEMMKDIYGVVSAVSLVDKHGSESVLANAFEQHFELFLKPYDRVQPPHLVAFDFHKHCAGKEYERGLSLLLEKLRDNISAFGVFVNDLTAPQNNTLQSGVFRVNCVDCLDRTNVVQSMIAREALAMQLAAIFSQQLKGHPKIHAPRLYVDSEDRFKHLWGDNADAVSKQYSGTGALKTDFTRTGKRSTSGVIGDGMKSVMRMYYKNFVDEGRQEVIDILCRNVVIRQPTLNMVESFEQISSENETRYVSSDKDRFSRRPQSAPASLWYSFEALRINAGGDKQPVIVELHDEMMYATTADSITLEFPRKSLLSWSKYEDVNSSDRKIPVRLRLLHKPSYSTPATASPLDLQFKGGTMARENFLRALISWSCPEIASPIYKKNIRVRVMTALNAGEHHMADWGLAPDPDVKEANEVVALMIPECSALTRSWGLAAVPLDVDLSDYVLISACAVSKRGPALAILASKNIASTITTVSQAGTPQSTLFPGGGATGVAVQVCGTSLCFVSAKLDGLSEVQATLASLKLGRHSFDVTNQFHHFTLAGLLGNVKWHSSKLPEKGPKGRNWIEMAEGSTCYTLSNGVSVLRNSFPRLRYDDNLNSKSLWRSSAPAPGKSASVHYITLSDGIVDGRPAPQLPKNLSQCLVTISDLRAEGMKMPSGVDVNSQMNSYVILFCDYATMDGVVSRQTPRASPHPEWKEPLHMLMMPNDIEEIYNSFIIGQVLIPTSLGDPISAGHFVIPIFCSQEEHGNFEVPCRLGGFQVGHIFGKMSLQYGETTLREASFEGTLQTPSSSAKDRSSLPPIPVNNDFNDIRDKDMNTQRRVQSSTFPTATGPYSHRQKAMIDDVSGKLEAARKKGSKQVMSVVSKLSSLLNQPSSYTSSQTPQSTPSIGTGEFDSYSSRGTFREASDEFTQGSLQDGFSQGRGPKNVPKTTTSANEKSFPFRSATPNSGRVQSTATSNIEGAYPASGVLQGRSTVPGHVDRIMVSEPIPSEDILLKGLQGSQVQRTEGKRKQEKPPIHFNSNDVDLLMNGLTNEKKKGNPQRVDVDVDEVDWGDFESARGECSAKNVKPAKASGAEDSLIDL